MSLKIKKLKPLYTNILTTGDKYEQDVKERGIIVNKKGDLKLYQTVLAVGDSVRNVQVGEKIMFTPRDYVVMKYSANSVQNDMDNNKILKTNFPWVTIDDEHGNPKDCLLLKDRDVLFVFEGEEVNEGSIVLPEKKLIV